MGKRNQAIVIFCAAVGFAVLYSTQPLLPLLAEQWQRPIGDTALLTTATMIPLALGVFIGGLVLTNPRYGIPLYLYLLVTIRTRLLLAPMAVAAVNN